MLTAGGPSQSFQEQPNLKNALHCLGSLSFRFICMILASLDAIFNDRTAPTTSPNTASRVASSTFSWGIRSAKVSHPAFRCSAPVINDFFLAVRSSGSARTMQSSSLSVSAVYTHFQPREFCCLRTLLSLLVHKHEAQLNECQTVT